MPFRINEQKANNNNNNENNNIGRNLRTSHIPRKGDDNAAVSVAILWPPPLIRCLLRFAGNNTYVDSCL